MSEITTGKDEDTHGVTPYEGALEQLMNALLGCGQSISAGDLRSFLNDVRMEITSLPKRLQDLFDLTIGLNGRIVEQGFTTSAVMDAVLAELEEFRRQPAAELSNTMDFLRGSDVSCNGADTSAPGRL